MTRVLILKDRSNILAGHGFQDQSVKSSLEVTKAGQALAIQLEAESVTL